MADGWRSRNMAPVYALVISFLLVLVFGLVLRTEPSAQPEPKETPTTKPVPEEEPADDGWQFRVSQVGNNKIQAPDQLQAFAMWDDMVTPVVDLEQLSDEGVDGDADDVIVCVKLPAHWSMPKPTKTIGDYTCTEPLKPKNDMVTVRIMWAG